MSKKNLLNEGQVRQFMKLARLEPLTPGFVHGLTEKSAFKKGEELEKGSGQRGSKPGDEAYVNEAEEDELEERRQTRPPGGGPGGGGTSHGRSSEPMPGDKALMREEGEDEELESELSATEDELGAEDELADDEGEELADLEGPAVGADEDRMVSVKDFLDALESALETAMGDEVEVDASEMEDELEAPEEEDFAPEGEDVVADVELEDEPLQEVDDEELEEGVFGGADKAREKLALGKKGSYAPDPEAGEKDYTPTPEEMAKARKEKRTSSRDKFPRGHSGVGGGWKPVVQENSDELVERITKRVAARILKSALSKK